MAKPISLAVGNILTLFRVEHGRKEKTDAEMQWRENTTHKLLRIPRPIVAARSKYVEVGQERSVLNYPKVGEYVETPETIVLTFIDSGGAGAPDVGTRLSYTVSKP